MVRFDSSIVVNLKHGEGRSAGQQSGQSAFMMGVEMLNQDESHARGGRQMAHQFGECLEAPGGGAHTHHHQLVGLIVVHRSFRRNTL